MGGAKVNCVLSDGLHVALRTSNLRYRSTIKNNALLPFLYTGFWIGFLSGVSAWFIVTLLMLILRHSIEKLSELYGGGFHLLFLSFTQTLALIVISSVLGVLGSWAVLIYQLQHTKPE